MDRGRRITEKHSTRASVRMKASKHKDGMTERPTAMTNDDLRILLGKVPVCSARLQCVTPKHGNNFQENGGLQLMSDK